MTLATPLLTKPFIQRQFDRNIEELSVGTAEKTASTDFSLRKLVKGLAISTALSLGAIALFASPAKASASGEVAQLLETGICKACDLAGADLTGAHLIGVELRNADLTGATLAHANLEGADLTGATLVDTDLSHAFLTNASLNDTVIRNVDLSESTLIHTSLDDASVGSVDLVGADVLNTPLSIGGSYDQ